MEESLSAESLAQEIQKAGPNKRVCAYIIDAVFINLVSWLIYSLLQGYVAFVSMGYWLLKDVVDGQSVGKRVVGIKVVSTDEKPFGFLKSILRNFILLIPIVLIIEYFVMLADKSEGRRLGDKLAKSKVVDLKPEISDMKFFWMSLVFYGIILAVGILIALSQNVSA